jgi:hypothetical protein
MASLISKLSKSEQQQLLDDLNYLNMGEIKTFCKQHRIPYSIWIQTADRGRARTHEDDRKGVILNRVREYLKTGSVKAATCFPAGVVCLDPLPKSIKPTDRLFYGQYDPECERLIRLLEQLTDGKFEHGAIARILAREFWSKGTAPTFQEFAAAWLIAKDQHQRPNPEWAFLSDRADGKGAGDWKKLRTQKAKMVLAVLNRLAQPANARK